MFKIVKLPDPKLRQRSIEVDSALLLSKETQKMIDEMIPIMYAADGIGLAAVQVGHNIRLCTIGKLAVPEKHKLKENYPGDLVLINPVWVKSSIRKVSDLEGCLSVPKTQGKVKRYKNIQVKAQDRQGNPLVFNASDYLARVIQHEVDHMDGILFIDKATEIKIIN